jgi:hypothetical protein
LGVADPLSFSCILSFSGRLGIEIFFTITKDVNVRRIRKLNFNHRVDGDLETKKKTYKFDHQQATEDCVQKRVQRLQFLCTFGRNICRRVVQTIHQKKKSTS